MLLGQVQFLKVLIKKDKVRLNYFYPHLLGDESFTAKRVLQYWSFSISIPHFYFDKMLQAILIFLSVC